MVRRERLVRSFHTHAKGRDSFSRGVASKEQCSHELRLWCILLSPIVTRPDVLLPVLTGETEEASCPCEC
jgi:hypothetical protein